MEFKEFRDAHQRHIERLIEDQNSLFVVDTNKEVLWSLYLDSFPAGTNKVYRERREMDCSCCRHFMRDFANAVVIENDRVVATMWGFETGNSKFDTVLTVLDKAVKSAAVNGVFVTSHAALGTAISREMRDTGVHTWNHFHVDLPGRFVNATKGAENAKEAEYRDAKNVFQRSLEEIKPSAVRDVLDMIAENVLYRGEEWQPALQEFLRLQQEYNNLPGEQRNNWVWSKSVKTGGSITRIRNHSIGVLLADLSNGVDPEEAVKKYERIVAPSNYKRPKPVFSTKMVEQAQQKVEELGLSGSLGRRHATLADITVNNVLWSNRDAARHMAGAGGVWDALKQDVAVNPRQFEHVSGVGVTEFMDSVLPTASTIEVLMENRLVGNLVSLIAPQDMTAPSLFKWDNSFSWAYNGNVADSMREQVKAAGGSVTGILRFSIRWNDQDQFNANDYDAHAVEPNGNEIYYARKHSQTGGELDVDIINPTRGKAAVENITWATQANMREGRYKFFVHCYSHRGGTDGFDAEVEFNGEIHEYSYRQNIPSGHVVEVATVEYGKASGVRWIKELPSSTSTRTVWNVQTNQFQPVSVVMYSPNHWDGQVVGNRHWFFMLAGCQNEGQPNGFYNEFLREDFTPHRKVFEALGNKMRVSPVEDQLSGLGFSSTQHNYLLCKVDGQPTKIIF